MKLKHTNRKPPNEQPTMQNEKFKIKPFPRHRNCMTISSAFYNNIRGVNLHIMTNCKHTHTGIHYHALKHRRLYRINEMVNLTKSIGILKCNVPSAQQLFLHKFLFLNNNEPMSHVFALKRSPIGSARTTPRCSTVPPIHRI